MTSRFSTLGNGTQHPLVQIRLECMHELFGNECFNTAVWRSHSRFLWVSIGGIGAAARNSIPQNGSPRDACALDFLCLLPAHRRCEPLNAYHQFSSCVNWNTRWPLYFALGATCPHTSPWETLRHDVRWQPPNCVGCHAPPSPHFNCIHRSLLCR